MTVSTEPPTAEVAQLHFLLPGVIHGMGNALFAIYGHAQVLGTGGLKIGRERGAILKGAEKATHALDILRYLHEDSPEMPPAQAGILLRRLSELVRVPLRECGLRTSFAHSSSESPALVDGVAVTRSVVEIMRQLAEVLPSGFEGNVEVDLVAQRPDGLRVALRVQGRPALLPFPLDLAGAADAARPLLERYGAVLHGPDERGELHLELPVAGA